MFQLQGSPILSSVLDAKKQLESDYYLISDTLFTVLALSPFLPSFLSSLLSSFLSSLLLSFFPPLPSPSFPLFFPSSLLSFPLFSPSLFRFSSPPFLSLSLQVTHFTHWSCNLQHPSQGFTFAHYNWATLTVTTRAIEIPLKTRKTPFKALVPLIDLMNSSPSPKSASKFTPKEQENFIYSFSASRDFDAGEQVGFLPFLRPVSRIDSGSSYLMTQSTATIACASS